MNKDNNKKLVIGKDIPWDSIMHKMCRVIEFNPFGKIEDGKLKAPKINKPYAFLTVELEKPPTILELCIFHKIDFKHLWQALIERKRNANEEVIIVWSKNFKNRFLKPISAWLPKLGVYIYPKGFFETKWKNPEWHSQFKGEAGFYKQKEELKPIASWKSDLIEWPF